MPHTSTAPAPRFTIWADFTTVVVAPVLTAEDGYQGNANPPAWADFSNL